MSLVGCLKLSIFINGCGASLAYPLESTPNSFPILMMFRGIASSMVVNSDSSISLFCVLIVYMGSISKKVEDVESIKLVYALSLGLNSNSTRKPHHGLGRHIWAQRFLTCSPIPLIIPLKILSYARAWSRVTAVNV
ncbi:hypothetical protein HAX54_028795 [Datura stramonium]|uniref:Uncharacterized protein n=1 Tax=Datura stramonium TaxID=4076 RepID=A0ABS8V7B4_DATST|nr:hypothetical protein [Datura stramonium]